jgi:enoyl-CoA hydratase/carnithine racemase
MARDPGAEQGGERHHSLTRLVIDGFRWAGAVGACAVVLRSALRHLVEATVGLHPLMGAIQRVAQRAGAARAKEMAMLARRYDARTLERWNVINRVVEDERLGAVAMTLARELVATAVNRGVRAADEAIDALRRRGILVCVG